VKTAHAQASGRALAGRGKFFLLAATMAAAGTIFSGHVLAEDVSPAEILQELRGFREMGSVLYVAAHPDDENTQLITYLARGRHYRTAYLSLTRGDGGQNVLGPEFGEELGVIRTQELLAARRLDGGRQFFTRAIDFGYSKDYRETLQIWNHQEVLSDVVRVIRTFQPDVIVAGFSTQPGGTHGHHTASAVLAGEAFKLAGDPKAFPDQLDALKPWQPKRLLQSLRSGNRGGENAAGLRIESGGTDPVLGVSFGELAGRSRAMHKSQGFGNFGGGGSGPQYQSFQFLAGEPATNDIMDGIDTTWNRVPGGAEIGKLADEIISKFDTNNPFASVPALLLLRSNLYFLPSLNSKEMQGDLVNIERQILLDHILQSCLGLSVQTTVSNAQVVPGEEIKLHFEVTLRTNFPIKWRGVESMFSDQREGRHLMTAGWNSVDADADLKPNVPLTGELTITVPYEMTLSHPYWLRKEPTTGMFRVDRSAWIGRPENMRPLQDCYAFQIKGLPERFSMPLVIIDEPVQAGTESGKFESRRTLQIIAPASLHCEDKVKLFAPGTSRTVTIAVTAARKNVAGELSLDAPAGWKIAPEKQPFNLTAVGQVKKISFKVAASAQAKPAQITARAKIGDKIYDNDRIEISYPHIPAQLLQPPARIKAVTLDLAIRGKKVGYVPGAGDSVAEAIQQLGYEVTTLAGDDLTTNRLKDFDAVVIGVRAFNVRTDLVSQLPALFAYVESGGNVIEQYNRPGNDLKTDQLAPFSLRLSGDRVTDETAPVTFLAPDHPALNTPNKITSADFDGWVQERGIYFPNQWDGHFTPILACADPGEEPKSGSLLVAKYGKGYFVYTGLVFFRQLPNGVPGAYRLFANLISLGK
jgi:LmbE family N-acetylglucosaminyl deacetylase